MTVGKPALTDIVVVGGIAEEELLALVASAERSSEQPLAAAIVTGARQRGMALADAEDFDSLTGKGVSALVGGRRVLVGNSRLLGDEGVTTEPLESAVERLSAEGKTPMFVAVDGRPAGVVAVAGVPRPPSGPFTAWASTS